MAKEDQQLFRSLMNPAVASKALPSIKRAFSSIGIINPDQYKIWVDIYQRPDRSVYYRVSFYVGWPPSGKLLTAGEQIATYLAVETGVNWKAYVAHRRTRATDSVKVVAEYDIDLKQWPISRLAQLPRWD